jgi:predicted metal-binding membrane protein
VPLAALLLTAALVAWIITVDRMRGMDAGPGTDLGGLGWYIGIWVTMMAAMMLPSAAPMVLFYARIAQEKAKRGQAFAPTWVFVSGYLVAWTAYGLVAYGIYRAIRSVEDGAFAWDGAGPYVAGAALAVAGLYELTPLKNVCLRHCRSPLHFVMHGFRPGWFGAFRMGAEHGAYCVGCCWGLMLALFAVGVMSLLWMAVVAGVIVAQKMLPLPQVYLTRGLAAVFVAAGIWVAAAPASVPGLVQPDSDAAELARMRMMNMEPAEQMEPGMKQGGMEEDDSAVEMQMRQKEKGSMQMENEP